jgi:hypothetical protein
MFSGWRFRLAVPIHSVDFDNFPELIDVLLNQLGFNGDITARFRNGFSHPADAVCG